MKPEGADHDHDQEPKQLGANRGISILDLVLRVVAIVGTLGSAVAMGTTDETLPFSTQAFIFQAQYKDIPTFRFVMEVSHSHDALSNNSFHYIVHKCFNFCGFLSFSFTERFFVIANATVCGYLAFSLPMAIYHIIRTGAAKSRALLIFLDAVKVLVLLYILILNLI